MAFGVFSFSSDSCPGELSWPGLTSEKRRRRLESRGDEKRGGRRRKERREEREERSRDEQKNKKKLSVDSSKPTAMGVVGS